ncbi:hypothetical protein [Holospora undulata]|uniref:Uncharacterized protein n=1 Tax=Holospora undulata HU1 TaxID=1321371 RepID=A0A061JG59_9PROT|nr:hypothetical protein [Holospora undulata]ETZ04911.1 hypothetical protein K737_300653 [Holospora undulata HU1]
MRKIFSETTKAQIFSVCLKSLRYKDPSNIKDIKVFDPEGSSFKNQVPFNLIKSSISSLVDKIERFMPQVKAYAGMSEIAEFVSKVSEQVLLGNNLTQEKKLTSLPTKKMRIVPKF